MSAAPACRVECIGVRTRAPESGRARRVHDHDVLVRRLVRIRVRRCGGHARTDVGVRRRRGLRVLASDGRVARIRTAYAESRGVRPGTLRDIDIDGGNRGAALVFTRRGLVGSTETRRSKGINGVARVGFNHLVDIACRGVVDLRLRNSDEPKD